LANVTEFLLEQPFPGATTCVLIGRPALGGHADFTSYKHVLWLVDPAGIGRPPVRIAPGALEVVAIASDTSALAAALDRLVARDARRMPSVFVTCDVAVRQADIYTPAVAEVHAILESQHRARFTRQQDGFQWQKHILANIADYAAHRVPVAWENTLAGLPAFVCGAGPSLDVSAPMLAAAASHGVVFAADSSLRALARRQVIADFAVSVDVAKTPEKCLAGETLPIRTILSPVSPPSWRTIIPATRRFFLSNNQITVDWLATQGVSRTKISVTESCGSTAIDFARFLGCTPIFLFGLDLAADPANPARRHHDAVETTAYVNSGYDAARRNPMVPGNYVEQLPSFIFGDWQALDNRLATWPVGLVFNVNDRGARLRNTTLVHPNAFSTGVTVDKTALLGQLPAAAADACQATALSRVRTLGALAVNALPRLRAALDTQGPDGIVGALRVLLANQDLARVMGAFSLKLLPLLMPPVEGDPAFWRSLLEEFAAVAELTQTVET
jgi:hypothetical protein